MRLRAALAATVGGALALAAGLAGAANAEAICTHDLRVLAQPRDGLTLLEKYKDEFKNLSGASFNIDYLNENDRRAKSRADASTVGKYNVYYIDEANVALFAKSKWVVPLLDYYPKEYDFADFDPGRQKVATYEGKVYFAPLTGGGDLLVYRKDLLEKAGIPVPKTLDEMIAGGEEAERPGSWRLRDRAARPAWLGRQRVALDALFPRLRRQVVRWRHASVRRRAGREGDTGLSRSVQVLSAGHQDGKLG